MAVTLSDTSSTPLRIRWPWAASAVAAAAANENASAKRSDTAIYAIGLRQGEIARREFKEAEFVLKQLANETGGRAFFVTDARELAKIYQGIWDDLASQYALAYSSGNPKRDGAWRRIQVRLVRPGATARTKQGYYGPTGS